MTLSTLAGGGVGSGMLLISSNRAFSLVVPFLLLPATRSFLYSDRVGTWAASQARRPSAHARAGLFAVSGYFNGGLGIVLLALFALWGMEDIHKMNALKNSLSFALSAISVAIFATAGFYARR